MGGAIGKIDAVLFDLDGTLIDTAPDMVAVLIDLQKSYGIDPLPFDLARSNVSNGALALVRLAFPEASDTEATDLHREYLDRYEVSVCVHSSVFEHLPDLLNVLDELQCPWGIVTNKPQRMTDPLLNGLGLAARACCAISGDTLPQRKPDPAPLLLGCEQAGTEPQRTVYVGDSIRDMQAARAARMPAIAAAYGYIVDGDDPAAWNPDAIARDAKELTKMLLKAVNLGS
jgi:phosphoglycolate phosphatase